MLAFDDESDDASGLIWRFGVFRRAPTPTISPGRGSARATVNDVEHLSVFVCWLLGGAGEEVFRCHSGFGCEVPLVAPLVASRAEAMSAVPHVLACLSTTALS